MKTTEVVAALIWDGGRFLICQRAEHKARGLLWEFPGGKVESGETGEQALAREHQEMRWVTPQEAGAFAFCPADRAFVERLEREAAAPDPAPAR
jgi:mutator protein MutT